MEQSKEETLTSDIMSGGLLNAYRLYRRELLNLRLAICNRQNSLETPGHTRRYLQRVVEKVDGTLMEVEACIGNLED